MQRAAASKESAQSQSQQSENPSTPSPKRQRLSSDDQSPSPVAQRSELEAISAAIATEEAKRREAVSRQAAEAGESEWVLDYPGAVGENAQAASRPVVVDAGSLDDEDESYGGRQAYGNFKRKKSVCFPFFSVNETGVNVVQNLSYLHEGGAEPEGNSNSSKSKPSKQRGADLKHVTSLSGTRQGLSGDTSQKKRKQK